MTRHDDPPTFKPGDRAEWNTPQRRPRGRVTPRRTERTQIKGHDFAASADHPHSLVVGDDSGAEAAHKPDALRKV